MPECLKLNKQLQSPLFCLVWVIISSQWHNDHSYFTQKMLENRSDAWKVQPVTFGCLYCWSCLRLNVAAAALFCWSWCRFLVFLVRLETIKQPAQTAGQLRVKSEKTAIKYPTSWRVLHIIYVILFRIPCKPVSRRWMNGWFINPLKCQLVLKVLRSLTFT